MKTKVFIEGMSCQHCVKHVTEALQHVRGVVSVDVSLEEKKAVIESNEKLDPSAITDTIMHAGFEVKDILLA